MGPSKNLNTYKVVMPYSESANPRKRFKIEYTIEASDRETALQKAEREFFAYTLYNSASWVRILERESIRVWRLLPNFPQTPQSIDDLAGNLKSQDPDVIYNTLKSLGELEDASPSAGILALLGHPNPDLGVLAAETLVKLGDPSNLPFLLKQFTPQANSRMKACVLSGIARFAKPGDPVSEVVALALGDEDPRVRANAVEAVEKLRLSTTMRMLVPLLEDEDNRVRANVLKALWDIHDRNALTGILQEMASSTNRWMRASAAFVLQHLPVDGRVGMLSILLADSSPEVQSNAWKAILKLEEPKCLPFWIKDLALNSGKNFALITEKVDKLGLPAFDLLLDFVPSSKEEKKYVRLLLDRSEQKIYREAGLIEWLLAKHKRFFSKNS